MPDGKAPNVRLIKTEDGSHTLYIPSLEETYHSSHGALQESEYVYINKGLKNLVEVKGKKEVSILEVGLGTGLNALLTAKYCTHHKDITVAYTTLEPFPIENDLFPSLNYPNLLPELKKVWKSIYTSKWEEPIEILENFELKKHNISIEAFETSQEFDLVYFHAFAPNKQPDIWKTSIFQKLHSMMKTQGILTTYCAQSQFKKDLKAVGFQVESLKGPPGKFEMVRGEVM